jgi:hypothetical protein
MFFLMTPFGGLSNLGTSFAFLCAFAPLRLGVLAVKIFHRKDAKTQSGAKNLFL